MRVVIPHTAVHPVTLEAAPEHAEWIDVSVDGEAYWRAMCEWWADGETFIVLEHDVICRPDVLQGFESCDCAWAAHKYDDMCCPECSEAWANTLGATRFTADLIAAVPGAASSIPPNLRHWTNMCDGLGNNLRAAGFTHHWHGEIEHHHMTLNDPRVAALIGG